MFPADLPPQLHDSLSCSVAAAVRYGIPANILLAVAEKEAGTPGLWMRNSNGTSDVGPMQFNTAYLATLAKYGVTPQAVAGPHCYAYDLAAWRLRQHIQLDHGDVWTRAANYHSRTPIYNARYRLDLMSKSARWADWLELCAFRSCPRMTSLPPLKAAATRPPALPQGKQALVPPPYVPRTITVAPAT
jgi:hypothetical protein